MFVLGGFKFKTLFSKMVSQKKQLNSPLTASAEQRGKEQIWGPSELWEAQVFLPEPLCRPLVEKP